MDKALEEMQSELESNGFDFPQYMTASGWIFRKKITMFGIDRETASEIAIREAYAFWLVYQQAMQAQEAESEGGDNEP